MTAGDLFHHFANKTAKNETARDYSYNENRLYYGTKCIAKIIAPKKKIVVIDKDFNRTGSFGNGYASWHIERAFEKDWTILYGETYKIEGLKHDKKTLYSLYFNTIKSIILQLVDKYQIDRELIDNNNAYVKIYYSDPDVSYIFELAKKFKLDERKIRNHIYNETHVSSIRYLGWGKAETNVIKIIKPISFWLDSTKWHTSEEVKTLEFKAWKAIWAKKEDTNGKTYKEIYNNLTARKIFEEKTTAKLDRIKKERELEEERRNAEQIKKEKEKLEDWKTGKENSTHFWYIPIELRLKDEIVETTKGATVPLNHAERLFKFFMRCIKEERTYISSGNNQSIDSIGVYHLREINKDNSGWFLRAGCHTIYQTAIEDFVKRYNLNW